MNVRKLLPQTHFKVAFRLRRPNRNQVGRFVFITLGSGAIAALLAILIAGSPTLLVLAFPNDAPRIDATSLFPKPSPVQKVVDVYDPAPPEEDAPRPPESEQPEPTDTPKPAEPAEPPEQDD